MDNTAGQGRSAVLAVDLGKTSCRAEVIVEGRTVHGDRSTGAPGLAQADGPHLAVQAVLTALRRMPEALRHTISAVGIGAAGAAASPEGARYVLHGIREHLPVPRAIASDVVTAHAGAFGGEAGSLVVAGTGAVGYRMERNGRVARADGWGVWLGDEGSGRWIGQQGLAAALRAHDGRGPHTRLLDAARDLVGPPEGLPVWIAASGEPGRDLGSFAPRVLELAQDGDAVANAVVDGAVESLTATALAIHAPDLELCFAGGVGEHPLVANKLRAALTPRGVGVVAPRGDAVRGAAILASNAGLPHEKQVIREQ